MDKRLELRLGIDEGSYMTLWVDIPENGEWSDLSIPVKRHGKDIYIGDILLHNPDGVTVVRARL